MKTSQVKKLTLHMIGFLAAKIGWAGCFPVSIAYFTAVYTRHYAGLTLLPVMFLGMLFSMPMLAAAKYGLTMILVVVLLGLLDAENENYPGFMGSLIAGFGVVLMEFTKWLFYLGPDRNKLFLIGVLEAVFVLSLSEIFRKILGSFQEDFSGRVLKQEEAEIENCDLRDREHIEGTAKALQKLAASFRDATSSQGMPSGIVNGAAVLEERYEGGQIDRLNRMWSRKLLENRIAVAGQLNEMAQIMNEIAEHAYGFVKINGNLEAKIKARMRESSFIVKDITVYKKKNERIEVFAYLKSGRDKCVLVRDAAVILSKYFGRDLTVSKESKNVVYKDYAKILFEEDTNFEVLYGVSRKMKTGEAVSGDNFSYMETADKKVVFSLSDGMGSGFSANRESEKVIELLEQFLEAGFCKSTAIRMINSVMLMQPEEQGYATMDISEIDLYSGVCEFLKIGASTTFIKREGWVEAIQSTSLPVGMFHKADLDTSSKKLYDGDYIVMVTDGVLDRIDDSNPEDTLRDIILETTAKNPKEMSTQIMESVLEYGEGNIKDDMTIFVIGVWNK